MSDGALREHARALRETRDGSTADAAGTRQRILAAAYGRARRRRAMLSVCASMAAVLLLSTAWAALTGRLPRVLALAGLGPTAEHRESPRAGASAATPAAEDTTPSAPTVLSTASAMAEGTPPAAGPESAPPARAPSLESSRAHPPVGPRAAPAPSFAAAAGAEQALYETAHREHFVVRNPSAALRAWDTYLAAYPGGRFAPEARYNRALTLVRLSRTEDARAALLPFAEGRYGGYRQTEARELLDALTTR